jgi:hypothetical protein
LNVCILPRPMPAQGRTNAYTLYLNNSNRRFFAYKWTKNRESAVVHSATNTAELS